MKKKKPPSWEAYATKMRSTIRKRLYSRHAHVRRLESPEWVYEDFYKTLIYEYFVDFFRRKEIILKVIE